MGEHVCRGREIVAAPHCLIRLQHDAGIAAQNVDATGVILGDLTSRQTRRMLTKLAGLQFTKPGTALVVTRTDIFSRTRVDQSDVQFDAMMRPPFC